MIDEKQNRATRRAREREERDRARLLRSLALRTAASLADQDATVSGFTLLTPDGAVQYLDADALRRGGRA